jgi:hypothetical protein
MLNTLKPAIEPVFLCLKFPSEPHSAAFVDHQHALRPLIIVITRHEARARLLIHKARYLT